MPFEDVLDKFAKVKVCGLGKARHVCVYVSHAYCLCEGGLFGYHHHRVHVARSCALAQHTSSPSQPRMHASVLSPRFAPTLSSPLPLLLCNVYLRYGFPEDYEYTFALDINGQDTNWPLGSMMERIGGLTVAQIGAGTGGKAEL